MTTYAVYEGDEETLKDHASYLTAGKKYKVDPKTDGAFEITHDEGRVIYCLWKGCAHLPDVGDWTRIDE